VTDKTVGADRTVQKVTEGLEQRFFGVVFHLPKEDRFAFQMKRGGSPFADDGIPVIEVDEETPQLVLTETRRRARARKIFDIVNLPL
jgi:hypothetical protein